MLYAIACSFQTTKNAKPVNGLAICTDPDTPMTFIFPDGKPYNSDEIWSYKLHHFTPWAKIEISRI